MAMNNLDHFFRFIHFYQEFDLLVGGYMQMASSILKDEETLSKIKDDSYYNVYEEGGIIFNFKKEIISNLIHRSIDKKVYLEEIYYYGIIQLLPNYIGSKPLYEPLQRLGSNDEEWDKMLSLIRPVFYQNLHTLQSFAYEIRQIADGKGVFLHDPDFTLDKIHELRLNVDTHNYLKFIEKNEVDKGYARYLDSPAPWSIKATYSELSELTDKPFLEWPWVKNDFEVTEEEPDGSTNNYNANEKYPSHRAIIFAHNFRVEAGSAEPITTKKGWVEQGLKDGVSGNYRANQWYTTIPRNKKSYNPPRQSEILTILHLLRNEPQALEKAKQGIITLLKEFPDRLEEAKEIVSKY